MIHLLFFLFLSVSFSTNSAIAGSGEICLPFSPPTNDPPPATAQGRPGKIGPIGVSGQKGDPGIRGPAGECSCNISEISELRNRLEKLNETLTRFMETSPAAMSLQPEEEPEHCTVGMEDGRITDDQITASSNLNDHYAARYGRLNNGGQSGQQRNWIAAGKNTPSNEWLQVDIQKTLRITGVTTEGRLGTAWYPQTYKISYGLTESSLRVIQGNNGEDKIFQGNTDDTNPVTNRFNPPITARFVRFIVQAWNGYPSGRLEYLLC